MFKLIFALPVVFGIAAKELVDVPVIFNLLPSLVCAVSFLISTVLLLT